MSIITPSAASSTVDASAKRWHCLFHTYFCHGA
jgi:hypothetical protein